MSVENLKKAFRVLPWLIVMVLLWLRGCDSGSGNSQTVTKEKKGAFEAVVKPVPVPAPQKVYVTKWKDKIVETPYPVNQELYQLYMEALAQNDSLAQQKLFVAAIQEKTYKNEFDNDDLLLTVETGVRGDMLFLKPVYKIKPQKVPGDKQTYLRFFAGAELGNNLQFTNPVIKGNVGLQNKAGDIFTAAYDADGTIYFGFYKSILNLKK